MPIIPCSGTALWTRHRKSCACSSGVGCLKEVTRQPCGLTLSITFLIVPSLPLVSIPCSTSKTALALRGVAQLLQLAQLRLQRSQLRLPLLRPTPSVWRGSKSRGWAGAPRIQLPGVYHSGGALTRRPGKQRTIDGHTMTHTMRATIRGGPCGAPGGYTRGGGARRAPWGPWPGSSWRARLGARPRGGGSATGGYAGRAPAPRRPSPCRPRMPSSAGCARSTPGCSCSRTTSPGCKG